MINYNNITVMRLVVLQCHYGLEPRREHPQLSGIIYFNTVNILEVHQIRRGRGRRIVRHSSWLDNLRFGNPFRELQVDMLT